MERAAGELGAGAELCIGEWKKLRDRDPAGAWWAVFLCAQRAARSLRRRADRRGDLAAEILLRCMARDAALLRKAPEDAVLEAWVFGVARNMSRRNRARRRVWERVYPRFAAAAPLWAPSPEEDCVLLERAQILRALLLRLHGPCRRIFELRLSGLNRSAVRRALSRESSTPKATFGHLWKHIVKFLRHARVRPE